MTQTLQVSMRWRDFLDGQWRETFDPWCDVSTLNTPSQFKQAMDMCKDTAGNRYRIVENATVRFDANGHCNRPL
jgi:hypothetical protein